MAWWHLLTGLLGWFAAGVLVAPVVGRRLRHVRRQQDDVMAVADAVREEP